MPTRGLYGNCGIGKGIGCEWFAIFFYNGRVLSLCWQRRASYNKQKKQSIHISFFEICFGVFCLATERDGGNGEGITLLLLCTVASLRDNTMIRAEAQGTTEKLPFSFSPRSQRHSVKYFRTEGRRKRGKFTEFMLLLCDLASSTTLREINARAEVKSKQEETSSISSFSLILLAA